MTITVDKYDLKPGQWVIFSHETKRLQKWTSSPYRIIRREDEMDHLGCCRVMNFEGKIGEYCPRMNRIHEDYLPFAFKVRVLTTEEAQELLGGRYYQLEGQAKQQMIRANL